MSISITVFFVFIIIFGGIAFYFYNFYNFKTIKFCIPNEGRPLPGTTCSTDKECLELITQNIPQIKSLLEKAPAPLFMKEKINEVFEKSIYCDGICFISQAYGDGVSPNSTEECKDGDEEILIKINGRRELEMLTFAKNNPNILIQEP